jgi:hypothetical protein
MLSKALTGTSKTALFLIKPPRGDDACCSFPGLWTRITPPSFYAIYSFIN